MIGPYKTNGQQVDYIGNKLYPPLNDVLRQRYSIKEFEGRVKSLIKDKHWYSIARINHTIYTTTNDYFNRLGALFTLLPLTTRMISSPGALYGKKCINYTSDTTPITLRWFNQKKPAFLSESSQIYLELALTQQKAKSVYSIYNSFRKEKADTTHLSEFHHIEFEGKVDLPENTKIAFELLKTIIRSVLKNNRKDLHLFLTKDRIAELDNLSRQKVLKLITFKEVLSALYNYTGNKKYRQFTLKHFGVWEEVKLTELYGGIIGIKEFPLLEVAFYHSRVRSLKPPVAENLDIIWPSYREILGSGQRVRSLAELKYKARVFNLPKKDYKLYLQSRAIKKYIPTCGFGLGWERFLQGLLQMPCIWSVSHFPRVDKTLFP